MKKLFFLATLLFVSQFNLWAYNFAVNGIYYNKSGSEASVTYKNTSYNSYSGKVTIPETVTYSGTTYSVTSIGGSAFQSCTGLTQITIPESVTSIGRDAFYGCTNLTEITSKNLTPPTIYSDTFEGVDKTNCILNVPTGCEKMYALADYWNEFYPTSEVDDIYYIFSGSEAYVTYKTTSYNSYSGSVIVPETVTYNGAVYRVTGIGNYAFQNCTGLTEITIPENVTSIGNYAFQNCTGLTEITIPENVTYIGWYAFYGCTGLTSTTIPEGVTFIGDLAFFGCTGLITVNFNATACTSPSVYGVYPVFSSNFSTLHIGDNVTTIPAYLFYECTGLTEVTIPDNVTSIGNYAFQNCTGLTSITLPGNITSISSYAFSGCTGLTSITLPENVTSIGWYTFYGCTGLTSITIPESVTSIGDYAFYGCAGLTAVSIPESVTSIEINAFRNCTGLTTLILEDSEGELSLVTSPFTGCPLKTLYMGRTLSYYSNHPFENMTSLTDVTFGNEVTSIGTSAFSGCTGLTGIMIPSSVISIGSSAFGGCTGVTTLLMEDGDKVLSLSMDSQSSPFTDCPIETLYLGRNLDYDESYPPFKELTTLIDLTVGNKVFSLPDSAFYGCTELSTITLGSGITSIGSSAFEGCTSLAILMMEDGTDELELTTTASTTPFTGCPIQTLYLGRTLTYSSSYSPFREMTSLSTLMVGDRVTSIGNSAFMGCTGLTEVTLPYSVISVGTSAFNGCTALTEATVGNGVTSIGDYAFNSCTELTEVTLGHSVASIGNAAFFGDKKLEEIYTKNKMPPTISNSLTFNGVDKSACTLYVPTSCKSLYAQATYWKDFYNISEVEYPVESDGIGDIFTDAINEEAVISFETGAIVVQGENLPVAIYDLTGRLLRQETVQQEKRIELPGGCYIVKAGNIKKKVLLRD